MVNEPKGANPQLVIDNLLRRVSEVERDNAILQALLQESEESKMQNQEAKDQLQKSVIEKPKNNKTEAE